MPEGLAAAIDEDRVVRPRVTVGGHRVRVGEGGVVAGRVEQRLAPAGKVEGVLVGVHVALGAKRRGAEIDGRVARAVEDIGVQRGQSHAAEHAGLRQVGRRRDARRIEGMPLTI